MAEPRSAGPAAAAVAAEARQAGDAEALVVALRAVAWAARARGANDQAKPLLDEAVRVAAARRLPARLGEVLVTRAAVHLELGRLAAAQRDLDRAAPLVAAGGGRAAELDLAQGALLQNVGRLAEAAAVYRRVLGRPDAPVAVRAIMANNLALIEAEHGQHDAAIARLGAAAELAGEAGPAVLALVTQSRAWVSVQAGRLSESVRLFDQAAARYEAAGLSLGEHYLEHVDALVDLRLLPEAAELAARAVASFEAGGVRLMGAEAKLRAAQVALLAGDHQAAALAAASAAGWFRGQRRAPWAARAKALEVEARRRAGTVTAADVAAARRAAATLERLGLRSGAVDAWLTAGRAAVAAGRGRAALPSLRRAQALAAGAPVLVRLKGRVAAASAAGVEGSDRAVLHHCRAGLGELVSHRAALPSLELRALASGHGAELGRLGLRVLLGGGSPTRVLAWLERTRAASLFALEPAAALPGGVDAELAALRAVNAELVETRRGGQAEPPALLARQAALERQVRRATWSSAAAGAPGAGTQAGAGLLGPAELRARLGGRVLVEYGAIDGALFAVVLEPRRARLVQLGPLGPVTAETDALQFALRRLARGAAGGPAASSITGGAALAAARGGAEASLAGLRRLLVEPLGLDPGLPAVLVPSAWAQRIPWSALYTAPLALAPSASFWAATQARPAPGGRVVLVAGPDLGGAETEVKALAELHRTATVLAPPAGTVDAVVEALDGASLVHLACHGRLRADNPTFSALELSDGPLTVHELDLRGIAPHRLVLAACEAAAGVGYEGDEVLGFVSALMARGTAGLVASAVLVPDVEVVGLMLALHERLVAGASLADALHGARATVNTGDPAAFVTWCAFSAFGAA